MVSNKSARAAGVGKETGYRWLREAFLALREQGLSGEAAQVELGYFSPLVARWDRRYPRGDDQRHHLRVDAQVEQEFWRLCSAGASLEAARRGAEVGRSTAYRWWQARYVSLREEGVSVRVAARQLRVPVERATAWEAERRGDDQRACREREAAERRAVRDSARHAEGLMRAGARREIKLRDANAGHKLFDRVHSDSVMAAIFSLTAVPIMRAVMENRTSATQQAVTTSER